MDDRKECRRAYLRRKQKLVLPWKGMTILTLVLSLILVPLAAVLTVFDNTVAAFAGGTFWKLENEDPTARYFTSDFSSAQEMADYGQSLCRQVEAEGAALLYNENSALPLARGAAVSCFSTSSVNLVYGGTGSGNIDASRADTLKTALEASGFRVNETLWEFYTSGPGRDYLRRSGGGILPPAAAVSEAPWSAYTGEAIASAAQYGDAAIVVLSRIGGEGSDLEYREVNYLALDPNERELLANLAAMKREGTIRKIILLINSANALQMDFMRDNPYSVDACLWIGDVGGGGIGAAAEILAGGINPSGCLADTYCYDNASSPAMRNFTPIPYSGYQEGLIPADASTYMLYQEGIYVGYKYYETRYEDTVMGTGNAGDYDYGSEVAFPFGYGLSYTTFVLSGMDAQYDPDTDRYLVTVTVTNTGESYAGRKTVQVYVQSPYTRYDVENHVEKASVSLVGFGKTGLLAPGASETLQIPVRRRDIASYDAYGAGTYILDAGDYYLTAAENAHQAVNNILAAKGYTTGDGMDAPGSAELTWHWDEPELDAVTYSVSASGTPIVNRLSGADPNRYEGSSARVTYLSRSDWQGTFPGEPVRLSLTGQMIEDLQNVRYNPDAYEAVPMPTLGADNGKKLYDMIGLSYDDSAWEPLLDQLTFKEMVGLIGDSFHWRMPVPSAGAPGTRDENGPQGLTASLLGSRATQLEAAAFPSEDVMAATFDTELMYRVGRLIGNNCLEAEVVCLYGPGNNIHRTPYGGRNFEYYSEDGFLSGTISAAEVKGIQDKGVDVVLKHFALNDSEQDRIGLGVWVNEQAAREIYLKAFQAPIEDGGANGVMTAYTRWGCVWSGGNRELMTGILREEWGSRGMSITDNVLTEYVNGADGILAGTSTFDAMLPYVVKQLSGMKDDPVIVSAMRQACHRNLYALANSSGMNGVGPDTRVRAVTPYPILLLWSLALLMVILCAAAAALWVRGAARLRETEEYAAYQAQRKERRK